MWTIQRFEGLIGDESDGDEEEAEEAEDVLEQAQFCDDGLWTSELLRDCVVLE